MTGWYIWAESAAMSSSILQDRLRHGFGRVVEQQKGAALLHKLIVLLFIHVVKTQYVLKQHTCVKLLARLVLSREVTHAQPPPSQLKQNAMVLRISVRLASLDHTLFLRLQLLLLLAELLLTVLVLLSN